MLVAKATVKLSLGPDTDFNTYFIFAQTLLHASFTVRLHCLEVTTLSEACKQFSRDT